MTSEYQADTSHDERYQENASLVQAVLLPGVLTVPEKSAASAAASFAYNIPPMLLGAAMVVFCASTIPLGIIALGVPMFLFAFTGICLLAGLGIGAMVFTYHAIQACSALNASHKEVTVELSRELNSFS